MLFVGICAKDWGPQGDRATGDRERPDEAADWASRGLQDETWQGVNTTRELEIGLTCEAKEACYWFALSCLPGTRHWVMLTEALKSCSSGTPCDGKALWLNQTVAYPVLLSGRHTEVAGLQLTEWGTPAAMGSLILLCQPLLHN